jgi:small ligand-binding sensory domain FIST
MPVDMYLRRFNEDHPGIPVIGGMASGGMGPGDNRLLLGDQVLRDGAVGVRVSGAVEIRTVVSQGCRPVGEPLVVTDCDRNAILKLGGRPALDRVQELYSALPAEDRQLFQRAPHIGVVMDERQDRFGPGDFLIRNVIGVDPGHSAVFVGDLLRRGQTVQLHVRDGDAAREDLAALLEAAERDLANPGPRGALLFTCNGRGTRLFSGPNHDIGALVRVWGSIPVGGFFAAGELGPVAGTNHLHGFTACVALFTGK